MRKFVKSAKNLLLGEKNGKKTGIMFCIARKNVKEIQRKINIYLI